MVNKNEYQDFYLVMRERFKSVIEGWNIDTDPLKHVFEVSLDQSLGYYEFLIACFGAGYWNSYVSDAAVEADLSSTRRPHRRRVSFLGYLGPTSWWLDRFGVGLAPIKNCLSGVDIVRISPKGVVMVF